MPKRRFLRLRSWISADRVSRLGVPALAGVSVLWATTMIGIEAVGASGPDLRRADAQAVSRTVAETEIAAAARAERVVWTCRPDVTATALNVRTDQILRASESEAPEMVVLRDTARQAALATILCRPLDAGAWLLLAMTSGSGDPSGAAVRSALELSYWTGTLDPALLMRRILFVDRFVQAGGRDFSPPLEDDINRLVDVEADEAVALIYRDGTPPLRSRLRAAVDRLDDPVRRAAHLAVFDRLDEAIRSS